MNAEQASFEIDARSPNERYADEYRASLASRAKLTGQARAVQADPEGFGARPERSPSLPSSAISSTPMT